VIPVIISPFELSRLRLKNFVGNGPDVTVVVQQQIVLSSQNPIYGQELFLKN